MDGNRKTPPCDEFGTALQRWRMRRGLSLAELQKATQFSRSHLNNVEHGVRQPTDQLARACDLALETGGELERLFARRPADQRVANKVSATDGTRPRLAQLPAVTATFVGRVDERRHLEWLLTSQKTAGSPRLAAIDGPAGAGKTALALRVAHDVRDRFPDGQLYVDLRGYSPNDEPARPAVVLDEFLVALGAQAAAIPSDLSQRAALYRSLLDGRKVLVVLDNALDRSQVEPLLPASDRCGVLLTSRRNLIGLEIDQNHHVTLAPFTGDESSELLRVVIGDIRVREEPDAARTLAERCDHLPLALRIAAVRVASHPHRRMADLVEELSTEQGRLDALSDDGPHAVRAVFACSYRGLHAATARMFRLLGVHPGPHISVGAAAALADVDPPAARRLLDRLVEVHLVEGAPGDRYQMHDLLHEYAAELALIDDTERQLARQRLLDWYLHTAYAANHVLAPQRQNPQLPPPRCSITHEEINGYEEALAWCDRELPNLVAATRMAVEAGEYEIGWKLPVGMWNFLFLRKPWSSWITSHQVGLVGARRGNDQCGTAWLLNNLALAFRDLRRFTEARRHLDRALRIRREIGDQVGEAWTLTALGYVDADLSRFESAEQWFRQALTLREGIANTVGDSRTAATSNLQGQSVALANLGLSQSELHRCDEAQRNLQHALAIAQEISDHHGESYILIKLSATYRRQHRTDEALDAATQALNIRRTTNDRWGEAEVLHSLGYALLDGGQVDLATQTWQDAAAIFDELGDPHAHDVRADIARIAEDAEPSTASEATQDPSAQ